MIDLVALKNLAESLRNEVLLLRSLSYLGRHGFTDSEWKEFDQSFVKAMALAESLTAMIVRGDGNP